MSTSELIESARRARAEALQRAQSIMAAVHDRDLAPDEERSLSDLNARIEGIDADIAAMTAADAAARAADAFRPAALFASAPERSRPMSNDFFSEYLEKRATFTTSGGTALQTTAYWGNIWPVLASETVTLAAGITVIETAASQLALPGGTALAAPTWIAEGGTATAADAGYGVTLVTPTKLQVTSEFSEEVLADAPGLRDMVARDLVRSVAIGLDKAVIEGSGSGEPRGIKNTSNISTVSLSNASFTNLDPFADAMGSAMANNARITAWIAPPAVVQQLAKLHVGGTAYDNRPLLSSDQNSAAGAAIAGSIFGVPVYVSSQMTVAGGTAAYVLGVEADQVVLVRRKDFELTWDPYTKLEQGIIRVRIVGRFGVALPNPKAAVAITAIKVP